MSHARIQPSVRHFHPSEVQDPVRVYHVGVKVKCPATLQAPFDPVDRRFQFRLSDTFYFSVRVKRERGVLWYWFFEFQCFCRRKSTKVIRYEPPHGKSTICIGKNKGAYQLRSNCEADQRLCFRYTNSTIPLLSKSKISSL